LDSKRGETQQLKDVTHRLEELEAHIADRVAGSDAPEKGEDKEALAAKASALATSDVKKTVQPELDALNRAMRRYEKRTTISSVQFEARLQDLEARLNDVVYLAAAAQRNADRKSNNYIVTLTNWVCAAVVIPVQQLLYVSSLPGRLVTSVFALPSRYLTKRSRPQATKDSRTTRKSVPGRSADRERRTKLSS